MSPIPANYQPAPDLLRERIILVTGAGDGIGRVAAETYAAFGATVILLGRTLAKLEAVYDASEAAGHPQPVLVELDLATAGIEQYRQLAGSIADNFGRLDGLLHNAALLGERRPIESANIDEWEKVLQVNVTAEVALTQAMLPLLNAAPNGSIVFTSSGVGRKGRAYWGAYAVSKFATEGLMQTLADELENTTRTRANSLNPGATRTAMRAAAYPGEDPDTLATPADLMPAYLYLMGDDSIGVTGQALNAQSVQEAFLLRALRRPGLSFRRSGLFLPRAGLFLPRAGLLLPRSGLSLRFDSWRFWRLRSSGLGASMSFSGRLTWRYRARTSFLPSSSYMPCLMCEGRNTWP